MVYFVYVLLCVGNTYYTGISTDVNARFHKHQSGKGAKYTRSHRPLRIVYQQAFPDKSLALKREAELKRLTHRQKELLTLA